MTEKDKVNQTIELVKTFGELGILIWSFAYKVYKKKKLGF